VFQDANADREVAIAAAGNGGMFMTHEELDAQLPIRFENGLYLDSKEALAYGERLSSTYRTAEPFPHIVIDSFLPAALANQILEHFPDEEKMANEVNFEMGYAGLHKRQIAPSDCDEFCRTCFAFLNSAPILEFLEALSGIKGLIPDPYFSGGGFHEISSGGLLGVHADFRLHMKLNLARRLNVLIYFNPGWQTEWGGQLGLWDQSRKNEVQKIDPLFNRCVVFNTDAESYHGHPDPLACPPDVKRRSIALYYYTASPAIRDEIPAVSTMYVPRPGEKLGVRFEALKGRMENHLKDWLPPVVVRAIRKAKAAARQ
jgi:2OG-Fe(II) oxygenase superfamily